MQEYGTGEEDEENNEIKLRKKRRRISKWSYIITYSKKDLISQFKTHIWGIMETQNGAIFHSAEYLLEKLDSAQRRFLHELDLDEATAFMEFNFAPPTLRRDIGLLGLLHKRVLGLAHPAYEQLFPFMQEYHNSHSK